MPKMASCKCFELPSRVPCPYVEPKPYVELQTNVNNITNVPDWVGGMFDKPFHVVPSA